VNDVVQAALLVADHPKAANQLYIVSDGTHYSSRVLYQLICQALNKPVSGWHIPLILVTLLAKIGDLIGQLSMRRFIFDSEIKQKLLGSAYYSSAKIETELGFKADYTLPETLPEIIRYLNS
jgi:nucleoside-diphosphate-sugar epimerase